MKPYPENLPDLCQRRVEHGPTPCFWPDCACDEPPKPSGSPFLGWLRAVLLSVSSTVVGALAWAWVRR